MKAFLIFLMLIFSSSAFAQNLFLIDQLRGKIDLLENRSNAGLRFVAPEPMIIDSAEKWKDFVSQLPELVDPESDYLATDLKDFEIPDFSTTLAVVVSIDAGRKGPVRFEQASISGQTLNINLGALDWGLKTDDAEDGQFNVFLLQGFKTVPKIIKPVIQAVKAPLHVYTSQDPKTELFGVKNLKDGKWAFPARYETALDFDLYYHAWVVDKKLGWIMIDHTGKMLYKAFVFDNGPDYTVEGLVRIQNDKQKIGFINIKGDLVIPAQFDFALPFANGKTTVFRSGKFVQEDEHSFYQGGEVAEIDRTGKVISTWRKNDM